jgi:hypothetical protein
MVTLSVRREVFQIYGVDQPVWRSAPGTRIEPIYAQTCLPVFLLKAAMNCCFSLSLTMTIRSFTRAGEAAVPKLRIVGKLSSGVFQTLTPSRSRAKMQRLLM